MNKLIIEKTIHAPIEKVWEAFTNPKLTKLWWSPMGATAPFFEAEVKEGGRFCYCHKMDDGTLECWGRGIYEKIDAPNYLSFRDCFTDEQGNEVSSSYYGMNDSRCNEISDVLVEFFFVADGEKTRLKMVQENPFDDQMASDMTDGWNQMFNKLDNSLI